MDILTALQNSLDEQAKINEASSSERKSMHPTVFMNKLEWLGCDEETIEDCLFEETDKWEWLLKYFEEKNNETKKDIKGS